MTKLSSLPNISSKKDEKIFDTMLHIYQQIKNERLKKGFSEKEMAEKLGIKRSTYQYWETVTPKMEKVMAVAEVLGLPKDYFFSNRDENIGTPEINPLIVNDSSESYLPQRQKDDINVTKLAQALADLAKSNLQREENYKLQALAFSELIELMKHIRNEMARERSLEEISSNLNVTLAGVETLSGDSERQEKIMNKVLDDLGKIKSRTAALFPDGGKK